MDRLKHALDMAAAIVIAAVIVCGLLALTSWVRLSNFRGRRD